VLEVEEELVAEGRVVDRRDVPGGVGREPERERDERVGERAQTCWEAVR